MERCNMGEFVNSPLSEHDMQHKLDEIRQNVAKKVNRWADRIQVSMAYRSHVDRVEGERWTEDGKIWEKKGGIAQNVSILQAARMPFWCPKCSKPMNHRFDRKFYNLRGWCYDCNINWEHQLKLEGNWEEFERKMLLANRKAMLKDDIELRMTYLREFKPPTLYFEDGRYEQLAPVETFLPMLEEVAQDIEKLVAHLEYLTNEEQNNDK
jgi:hypothetical protein